MAWSRGKSTVYEKGRWTRKCSWCQFMFRDGDVVVTMGTGTAVVHRACLKRALVESYEQVDVQPLEELKDQFAGEKSMTPKQMFDAYRTQLLEQFDTEEKVSA